MNLVENVIKLEKNYIQDFTGKLKKTSRITIGLTTLGLALIAGNKIRNTGPVIPIDQSRIVGNCCLEVESEEMSLEDVYLRKCEEAIKELDTNSKSYVLDDVLLDVISSKVRGNKNAIITNNILGDGKTYDSLTDQIIILASNISLNSKAYEDLYETIFADNIEECLGTFTLTSYCPCAECCGSSNGLTASGVRATANHTIAADKKFPFGTKLMINGTIYTVEDHGGAVNGNHIDVFYNTHSEALQAGTRSATVYLIKEDKKTLTR